ncbi:uncharacterized protein EDB91DRAFT_1246917 [Suillus paluster]|uniref:uncharacterized protein n=1 Tax=Suillus paluster TaxID=48578 RepID=UPI001B85BCA9|nr:uncharacterized protein EDB91DRAFT_1246917 [Suillus paluster]KAG1744032.1 hypothetical protein EDB91DRAFT_1246917 [Suillus paluster]
MSQGGHLNQLQNLESSQMKRQCPVKKNPAQDMIDSQPVNVMAPEAPKCKPRARPIKATSGNRNAKPGKSSNEKTEQHLSSSSLPQDESDSEEVDQDVDVDNVEVDQDDGDSSVDNPNQDHDTSKDSSNDETTRACLRVTDSSCNAQDVLQDHHAKNCHPHIPDLVELETLHQRATTQDSAQSSSEEEVVVPRKRTRTAKATVQNIHFYPPSWKDVLEATKKKSCLGLLTSTALKCSNFLQIKGIEYLLETLEDFGSQGVGVDDGYWDEYKSNMAVLLWDDRATMHSKMKKVACPIVLVHYEILPPNVDDKNDYEQEGRTNNLANEALGSFCMSYFYKGKNALAKTFPDLFADAVPKGAIALVATALAAAIDKYKTSTYKQMKFMANLYQPIYDNVIKLYGDVQKDRYDAKKCRATQKKWACTAGILTCNDPNRHYDWGLKPSQNPQQAQPHSDSPLRKPG